jgi:hypothetical protein
MDPYPVSRLQISLSTIEVAFTGAILRGKVLTVTSSGNDDVTHMIHGSLTSFRNTRMAKKIRTANTAVTAHGRKYGNSARKGELKQTREIILRPCKYPTNGGATSGMSRIYILLEIEANTHPNDNPTAQAIGNKANPCAIFVESVNSPSMLFMTPVFPLSAPVMQRLSRWRNASDGHVHTN